jgi:hypothetical protein
MAVGQTDIEVVDEVPEPADRERTEHHLDRVTARKVVLTINRALAGTLVLGFVFIISFSLYYPDRSIPDIVQNIVAGTVGYFGSALTSYLERATNVRSL